MDLEILGPDQSATRRLVDLARAATSELLKLSWLHHECSLEVSKPEVDNAGYDLIVEAHGVVRHIQLKTSVSTGSAANQKVHVRLEGKPSGCVLWIYFDEKTLELGPYRFFGDSAGKPLPSLSDFKIGKHTKGNKDGVKGERQNIRVIPKGQFKVLARIEDVYKQLFQIG